MEALVDSCQKILPVLDCGRKSVAGASGRGRHGAGLTGTWSQLSFIRNQTKGSTDSDIVGADEGEETKALQNVSRLGHRLQQI